MRVKNDDGFDLECDGGVNEVNEIDDDDDHDFWNDDGDDEGEKNKNGGVFDIETHSWLKTTWIFKQVRMNHRNFKWPRYVQKTNYGHSITSQTTLVYICGLH